jgi:hypothetical protein
MNIYTIRMDVYEACEIAGKNPVWVEVMVRVSVNRPLRIASRLSPPSCYYPRVQYIS